jgi:hypothetical protein
MTEDIGLGNELNKIVEDSRAFLFSQGELAQLSHSSFLDTIENIKNRDEEQMEISYPVGYRADRQPIVSSHKYTRDQLIGRYNYLTHSQIPINGVYWLAMITETMFADLIRKLLKYYPGKAGSKKQISIKDVLGASTMDEIHLLVTDGFLNELSYKSPRDFAVEAENILSIKLLECPAYHLYIEMKAARDVLIHNNGIVNDTYISKAGSHARAERGKMLPIDQVYFLEVYETCIKLSEWLEKRLHENWHSTTFAETLKPDESSA